MRKSILLLLAMSLVLAACTASPAKPDPAGAKAVASSGGAGEETPDAALRSAADRAVRAFKERDGKALAELVHPTEGVRFSPYGFVNTRDDLAFQADALPQLDSGKTYVWGTFDGSGEPIDKTFAQYLDAFVYDKDFASSESVTVDTVQGKGNTQINIADVYPDSRFVDYFIPGTDAQAEGMDWASLIVVFSPYRGEWKLVGVVHNQWTI